ncbi:hypothetical protein ACFQPG_10695 [Sphingomonas sp. GCM10030256]|uniref:hypothetical protein n=1 Tax=Sphingomonas sp. GCM10030256 TaxID=3273427 RepID=UPI003613F7FD
MADTKNNLPEGTDTVISGASGSSSGSGLPGRSDTTSHTGGSSASNSTGARSAVTSSGTAGDRSDDLITGGSSTGASTGSTGSSDTSEGRQGVKSMLSTGATKVKDEAGTRARGLVSQGLERGSSTLTNISGLVTQTAAQIEEQLGPQYGDYARKAGQALERYATSLSNKDPDELVDDARDLVRKSPGVAIAGAAILGFGLVRLIKAGLPEEGNNGNGNRSGRRSS